MYKHGSGDYFSLCLKSPADEQYYYILAMNGTLKIYSCKTIKDQLRDQDFYIFRIGRFIECSNHGGACPFQRMT